MNPTKARERGLTSTITFLTGNLAPQGAVIKSTAIDPSVVDADGVYRKTGPVRVFTSERAAIASVKGLSENPVKAGDIITLAGLEGIAIGETLADPANPVALPTIKVEAPTFA